MDENELKTALNELKADLFKYPLVYALASGDNLTEALKRIDRSKSWYYALSEEEQRLLNEIATALKTNPIAQAKAIIDDAVVDAAKVKVSGLKHRDPRIQQASSTEILDRTIGKTMDSVDVTSGGEKIIVTIRGNADAGS